MLHIRLLNEEENVTCWGEFFFKCAKILSQHHHFLDFLPSRFLPCKDTFMDDCDGFYNCNSLKYSPCEIFDNF
jgi:hypothetical protein